MKTYAIASTASRSRCVRRFLRLTLSLFLAVALAVCAACNPGENSGDTLRDFKLDTNLQLTDQDGRPFALKDLRDKTVLLYFGFTHCPDFCPATLSKIQKVYRILGNRSRHVQTILVTVDPERDTPEKLKTYLAFFEINAIGLTGTPAEIAETARRFGAHYSRPAPAQTNSTASSAHHANYTVDHSTGLYLIDSDGRVRHIFKHADSPQQLAETLQLILPFF